MGGPGSGARLHWWRPQKKATVETCLALPVSACRLRAGTLIRGDCLWELRDGQTFGVDFEADLRQQSEGAMTLSHSPRGRADGSGRESYAVDLVSTVPRFGGLRWWFLCPLIVDGVSCRRRA